MPCGSGAGGAHRRGDVNLRSLFQDFNASKFVVYTSLLCFTLLAALKLDGEINISWWTVFGPIWCWNGLVIAGALVGSVVWWRRPQNRLNAEEYIQYKAMLISLATHLLILMFWLMCADNLENLDHTSMLHHGHVGPRLMAPRHLWVIVFVPLVFVSIISIAICIWSVRHDRSFELELFCAVNILQFVFLALKLDRHIGWRWEIIFIPMWIALCVSLVGVLYTIIFAGILLRIPEVASFEQRRNTANSGLAYSVLVVPMLVFLVLLTNKLDSLDHDQSSQIRYFSVCSPLYLTFFTLIIASFGSKGGNQYWFGLRKPPCQFLFGVCPCLQLFGNISYSLYSNHNHAVNHPSGSNQDETGVTTTPSSGVAPLGLDRASLSSSMESPSTVENQQAGLNGGASHPDQGELTEYGPGQLLWGPTNRRRSDEDSATAQPFNASKKKSKRTDKQIVAPALTLEMPD